MADADVDPQRLTGVTELRLSGRGPSRGYVFNPHRLALPCWALGLGDETPALLLTLDGHLDLAAPAAPVPDLRAGVLALERHAREQLDTRNVDHILAAMEAGVVSDALVVARSSPRGARGEGDHTDRHGRLHRIRVFPTLEKAALGYDEPLPPPRVSEVKALIEAAKSIVLDVDLDCFTTPSDADPTVLLSWPRNVIRDFLLPDGARPFWDAVLARTHVLTLAREPYHVGGLVAAGRLFEDLAQVLFKELLSTDCP